MGFGGLGNYTYLCAPFERVGITYWIGEVVEWSITAVLKTVDVKASGGSNPSLSAKGNEEAAELALAAFLFPFAMPAAGGEGCATIGSKSLEGASPACFSAGESYP